MFDTFGEKKGEIKSNAGQPVDFEKFNHHRFKQIDIRKSIKMAVRHKHDVVEKNDLVANVLKKKSLTNLFILLDSSGSMIGRKMYLAKRASIALAYKAINDKNKVGFIGFNESIVSKVSLTDSFSMIVSEIVKLKPKGQTNISLAISEAIKELSGLQGIKHIILISDLLESFNDVEVVSKASLAKSLGITISLVTTNVEEKGKTMSNQIVEISRGKYYHLRINNSLENVVLEDYSYFS